MSHKNKSIKFFINIPLKILTIHLYVPTIETNNVSGITQINQITIPIKPIGKYYKNDILSFNISQSE